jgi:hypothetical protein
MLVEGRASPSGWTGGAPVPASQSDKLPREERRATVPGGGNASGRIAIGNSDTDALPTPTVRLIRRVVKELTKKWV